MGFASKMRRAVAESETGAAGRDAGPGTQMPDNSTMNERMSAEPASDKSTWLGRALGETSRSQPDLASSRWSRDSDGGIRGATFNLGANYTPDGASKGTTAQAVNVQGDVGWGGDEGFYGRRAGVTVAGASHDPTVAGESGFWGGARALDAGGSAFWDQEAGMGELGYRADIFSTEVGLREVNADSASDRGARVGVAAGAASFAARTYAQDADGDGRGEYGFGFSVPVGPAGVSYDYTTETPVGDVLTAGNGLMLVDEMLELAGHGDTGPASMMQRNAEDAWGAATDGTVGEAVLGATGPTFKESLLAGVEGHGD